MGIKKTWFKLNKRRKSPNIITLDWAIIMFHLKDQGKQFVHIGFRGQEVFSVSYTPINGLIPNIGIDLPLKLKVESFLVNETKRVFPVIQALDIFSSVLISIEVKTGRYLIQWENRNYSGKFKVI